MSNSNNCSNPSCRRVRRDILMSQTTIFLFASGIFAAGFFQSCGPSFEERNYRERSMVIADSLSQYSPGLVTDTIDGVTHNFIRNADLKCKVTNVPEASRLIEDLVSQKGGYVSLSEFSSEIHHRHSVKFRKDSLLELTHYTSVNTLTLRVPNKQLDTILRKISDLAIFIDHRRLRADDVKMDLFSNSLREKRLHRFETALQKHAAKHNSIKVEEQILEKQDLTDNTLINSYDLADKVNYSTLRVELYQAEQVSRLVLADLPATEPYTPPFTEQLQQAFAGGFGLLKSCVLFLAGSWGFVFFVLVLLLAFKRTRQFIALKLRA